MTNMSADAAREILWDIFEWLLKVLLSPIWFPIMVYDEIQFRKRVRPLVEGNVEDAWKRCCEVWKRIGLVCQWSDHDGAGFGHLLAVALAERQREQQTFFLSKVADPDPLLAAYAFKCLIRTIKPERKQLPAGSLQRTEVIPVLWADLVDEKPLGEYLEGWFREQESIR